MVIIISWQLYSWWATPGTLPFTSTNELLLEIEQPNLGVTFKYFAIAEDWEKPGAQFAEIIRGNTEVTS